MLENGIQVGRSRKVHVARGLILVEVVSEDLRLWGSGRHCWGFLGLAKMVKVPRQLGVAALYIGPLRVLAAARGRRCERRDFWAATREIRAANGREQCEFFSVCSSARSFFPSSCLRWKKNGLRARRKGLPAGLQVIQTRYSSICVLLGGLYVH